MEGHGGSQGERAEGGEAGGVTRELQGGGRLLLPSGCHAIWIVGLRTPRC